MRDPSSTHGCSGVARHSEAESPLLKTDAITSFLCLFSSAVSLCPENSAFHTNGFMVQACLTHQDHMKTTCNPPPKLKRRASFAQCQSLARLHTPKPCTRSFLHRRRFRALSPSWQMPIFPHQVSTMSPPPGSHLLRSQGTWHIML